MRELFGKRTLVIVIVTSLLSLAATVWIAIDVDRSAPPPVGANSYSYSADGHRAFRELLRDLDVPVLTSRFDTDRRLDDSNLAVFLDPPLPAKGAAEFARFESGVLAARRALICLPKRTSERDPKNRAWIARATFLSEKEAASAVEVLGLSLDVVRPEADPGDWTGTIDGAAPAIDGLQLIRSGSLTPIVACSEGILVGGLAVDRRHVVVVSDPDLFNNAGIGRGANAKTALAALEYLRPRDGVVVLDESTHGPLRRPGIITEVFEFPMALTVVQAAVVLVLYLWSGLGRFGKPMRLARGPTRGKRALIDNVAGLFLYGGRPRFVIGRYLDLCVRDVMQAMHVGDGAKWPESVESLARIGKARGAKEDIRDLIGEVRAAEKSKRTALRRSVDLARRLDGWRKEMLGESR